MYHFELDLTMEDHFNRPCFCFLNHTDSWSVAHHKCDDRTNTSGHTFFGTSLGDDVSIVVGVTSEIGKRRRGRACGFAVARACNRGRLS